MEEYLAIIKLFGGNFAPRGWMFCNGQTLAISQNSALFSLLGTTYGGNGSVTFNLPDLRGRAALGHGTGPGLTSVSLGELGGSETISILQSNLPPHAHTVAMPASTGPQTSNRPTNAYPTTGNAYSSSTNTTMPAVNSGVSGQGLPLSNLSPFLGLSYIICVEGIYPSRN